MVDKKVLVSEVFISLEGEAKYNGHPTLYIRYGMCNKKCPMWNNPDKQLTADGYAPLTFDPKNYNTLQELPLITMGCDSQYSVNPTFKHMWVEMTAGQQLQKCLDLIPCHQWVHPVTGQQYVLSLTGGEPTLRMKFIVNELLRHPLAKGLKNVLIETNCSVPLREKDLLAFADWQQMTPDQTGYATITWSNSPKLSNSGELWKTSIMPQVALAQRKYARNVPAQYFNQYFKFVVGSKEQIPEIKRAMQEYHDAGIPINTPVYLMPEACTAEQQIEVARSIAKLCIDEGYILSYRIHNALWGNKIGT